MNYLTFPHPAYYFISSVKIQCVLCFNDVKTYNYKYGGHPAPSGRALPNLINAVRMLKSK